MQSKSITRLLVGILSASLVLQMNIPAVYAAKISPKEEIKTITAFAQLPEDVKNITLPVDTEEGEVLKSQSKTVMATVAKSAMTALSVANSYNTPTLVSQTSSIYANGLPLLIEEGSNGNTKIKYHDGNNYVDWIEGDYQYYSVYGGIKAEYKGEPVQSASITMTGGKVSRIYAGGYSKISTSSSNVIGDASVTISGGTVNLVFCGGDTNSSIGGNATITVTGGNIKTVYLGGYEYDKIAGSANITITGGTLEKLQKSKYSTISGKKTGIITTTIVDATMLDNGFLKIGENSYIAKGEVSLSSDFNFTLPSGATLTVESGAKITNEGTITINGIMTNNGIFTNNGTVKNGGGSYSGSGTWKGNALEDLKLTVSTAKEITDSSAKFTVNCNKDAAVYYLASETPISDTSTLETKGISQSISANTDTDIALANLTGNTSYNYYMVAKAGETFTDIKTVSFTTLKKSLNLQLTGTVSGKVFDDMPISHSTVKGNLFTWDSDGAIVLTYFTDNIGTKTTIANSGAISEGDAPKNAGTYYVKATLSDNGGYVGAESDYIPFTITDEQLGIVSITVDEGTSYTINGTEYTASNTIPYSLGTNVIIAVSDATDFAYWVNDYGKIVSRNASYTFTVTGSMKLTAVYSKKVENKSTVIFESYYGQVMSRTQLGSGDTVTLPAGPTKYGYTFTRWSMTAEEIQNQISAGTAVIKVIPVYELINQSYTITVIDGAGSGSYKLNDLVTATANAPKAGMKFSHWTDKNGNILSYSTTYQFYATDVTITANYVEDTIVVETKGTAQIVNISKDTEKSKIIFVSMVTVPKGCKIEVAGVIGTSNQSVGTSGEGFNKDTAAYVRGNAWSGNAYRFTWTKNVTADQTWYVRAYLVYKDTNGNLITVYGDMITAKLNN